MRSEVSTASVERSLGRLYEVKTSSGGRVIETRPRHGPGKAAYESPAPPRPTKIINPQNNYILHVDSPAPGVLE